MRQFNIPNCPFGGWLNLITHVAVERADEHDKHSLLPAMEDADDKGLKPTTVLADSLYGSDDNVTDAAEQGQRSSLRS